MFTKEVVLVLLPFLFLCTLFISKHHTSYEKC